MTTSSPVMGEELPGDYISAAFPLPTAVAGRGSLSVSTTASQQYWQRGPQPPARGETKPSDVLPKATGTQQEGQSVRMVDVMALLVEHGVLLESARGPIPNVAELVAGEPITGSWWSHPASHAIFGVINELANSPDVVRLRLVNGKVTLVHRRVWPALVRVSDRIPTTRLASIEEVHTASEQGFDTLPDCLRPA